MPDFSLAISLLKKPIEDIYNKASDEIKLKVAELRAQSKVKKLHTKLWQIQRVKTIWNTDRPQSLNSIYHPVKAKTPDNKIKRINSVEDLGSDNVIIYGTAGQGKSILMKYLVGKEIKSGKRIPVLFELRNSAASNLESDLSTAFEELLGVSGGARLFQTFAKEGKLSLLLDGFDEISEEHIPRLMRDIHSISFRYPACKIIITSRPNSDCKNLVSFSSAAICPLQPDDFSAFFKKITRDAKLAESIVSAIQSSPHKIKELITTPLLATLLAISYRAAHKIPAEFSDFYEELFQVLLIRHDGSKMGWRRERKSGLADKPIQQLFEAFSFQARKRQTLSMEVEIAHQFAADGAQRLGFNPKPEHFILDIKGITCLLIEEGKKLHFVHASVAQFFASKFVKSLSEQQSTKFYEQLLSKWSSWTEEISFLSQIDSHRAKKYFLIPDYQRMLKEVKGGSNWIEAYLSEMWVSKSSIQNSGQARYVAGSNHSNKYYCNNTLDSQIFRIMFTQVAAGEKIWTVCFDDTKHTERKTYLEIAIACGGEKLTKIAEAMSNHIGLVEIRLKSMINDVKRNEEVSDFIDI
ncbi:NACHT domain-containing protein [Stenotrophomonas rhizophila]